MRSCTIALDNDNLVQALIRRRKLILELKNRLLIGKNFDSDNLEELAAKSPPVPKWKKVLCCASDANVIYQNIAKEESQIRTLSEKHYNVSSIFVIFETEATQREVLKSLSPPIYMRKSIKESLKFNGVVLDVKKTEEPSAIRWEDLNVPTMVSGFFSLYY